MFIGLDTLGGDFAPKNPLEGALLAREELSDDIKIVLIGDENASRTFFKEKGFDDNRFEYVHTTSNIDMGAHPTKALAVKPDSSIALGFKLLKEGKINGFASAGNTGAMLVGSMFSVKSVPGVIRPCIATVLPKENGGCGIILDVGTNADCKPDVLYQFGILGKLYAEFVLKVDKPKVALLNIGEEPEKGNLVTQAAYNLMKDSRDFNFVGNVEGRDLFNEKADVIVCEGFVGNIVLKTAESFYTLIRKNKLENSYFSRFNYEIYGGTPILGINGTVIIGHGISSPVAFKNQIIQCKEVHEARLPEKITRIFN
jgi:glycerol-3-phosphate acyltransferase PlsX